MRFIFAVLVALGSAGPAGAVRPQPGAVSDAQRFGRAFGAAAVKKQPTGRALKAAAAFKAKNGRDWTISFAPRTGIPKALFGAKTAARPGAPEAAARAFLRENRDLLQVDESELSLAQSHHVEGLHHMLFQQTRSGIPVHGAHVKVHMTEAGEIVLYDSSYEPPSNVSLTPTLSEAAARGAVAAEVDASRISKGVLNLYPEPSDGSTRLAWRFEANSSNPPGLWVVFVDAQDGRVLLRYNRIQYQACLTSGTVMGLVHPVDPVQSGADQQPVVMPMKDESVGVISYKNIVQTNGNGFYCDPSHAGKVFSSLRGPNVVITNHAVPSATYDNGAGQWYTVPSPASSLHPYPDSTSQQFTLTVPGYGTADGCLVGGGGGCFAKVMPHFSAFTVGAFGGNPPDWVDDDVVEVIDPSGNSVGVLTGDRGPTFGHTVDNPVYTVRLVSNGGGSYYGFDVDVSSYLVLTDPFQSGSFYNRTATFTWVDSASRVTPPPSGVPAPTFDGGIGEVNAFYQLGRIHDFFLNTVDRSSAAAISSFPAPVSVRFGSGLLNSFYDPTTRSIYFGDGGVTAPADSPFALDATVLRHEYVHFTVDHIFPILNYGQNGAWSEGLADYFAASSFQGEPAPGGPGGLPHIGRYLVFFYGLGAAYTSLENSDGQLRDLDSEATGIIRRFPDNWFGEVHTDGLVFSQALWRLRKTSPTGTRSMGTMSSGPFNGAYKADVVAFQSLFFYPESFEEFLQAALTVSKNTTLGFTATSDACLTTGDCSKVLGAFGDHGIRPVMPGSDVYEPNDGPATATDVSSRPVVQATIFPAGDLDVYSLPLGPGRLHATLTLPANPAAAGTYFAYEMDLLDTRNNQVGSAAPVFDVNPAANGLCPETDNCLTTAKSVSFDFDVVPFGGLSVQSAGGPTPQSQDLIKSNPTFTDTPGQYYLVVGGGAQDQGSNSITNSVLPYTLSLQYSPRSIVSGGVVNATFDNDTLSFSVAVSTFLSPYYTFSYAQLRDQSLAILPKTKTTDTGTFLSLLSVNASGGWISGKVQLATGFAKRFPAVGTVYLELYGTSVQGALTSLGTTGAINLTTNTSDFKAWNNVFNPGQGQKATFRYDVNAAGNMTIKLYTMTGTYVATLFDGPVAAGKGSIDWAGLNAAGNTVASGVYLVRIEGPGVTKTVKAVVVK